VYEALSYNNSGDRDGRHVSVIILYDDADVSSTTTAAIAMDDTSASSYNSRGLVYDKIGEVPRLLALLVQKYKY
jgi:hypothetical protein